MHRTQIPRLQEPVRQKQVRQKRRQIQTPRQPEPDSWPVPPERSGREMKRRRIHRLPELVRRLHRRRRRVQRRQRRIRWRPGRVQVPRPRRERGLRS